MKREALEVEEFDQCKQLKTVIDKLKIIGNQIVNMTREKDMAIANEDYDIAKQLKYQIEKIKEVAYQLGGFDQQDNNQQHMAGHYH